MCTHIHDENKRSNYITLHDPPYHKTKKKCEDFEGMVVSLLSPSGRLPMI